MIATINKNKNYITAISLFFIVFGFLSGLMGMAYQRNCSRYCNHYRKNPYCY